MDSDWFARGASATAAGQHREQIIEMCTEQQDGRKRQTCLQTA
jgi:hypothetical protein